MFCNGIQLKSSVWNYTIPSILWTLKVINSEQCGSLICQSRWDKKQGLEFSLGQVSEETYKSILYYSKSGFLCLNCERVFLDVKPILLATSLNIFKYWYQHLCTFKCYWAVSHPLHYTTSALFKCQIGLKLPVSGQVKM